MSWICHLDREMLHNCEGLQCYERLCPGVRREQSLVRLYEKGGENRREEAGLEGINEQCSVSESD